MKNTLVPGQIVMVQGYEFEVIELQGAAIAPDGRVTEYFKGRVTDAERNDSIRRTGFAEGSYSWRQSDDRGRVAPHDCLTSDRGDFCVHCGATTA